MAKTSARLTNQAGLFDDDPCTGAEVISLDEVAQRRERLVAYAEQTRAVIVYRFVLPEGATVASLGASGEQRDARAQLQMIVGLVGGAVGKSHGGLAARIPKILASKFEAMAGPLVEAYLVALDLGENQGAA